MNKEKIRKFVDSIAYIVWSLSIWMLSYYQLLEIDFTVIQEGYRKAIWLWAVAAVILYGDSRAELGHEIFKSCTILIGSSVFNFIYNSEGTIYSVVKQLIPFLFYQVLGYLITIWIGSWKKLNEKHTKKIILLFLFVIGICYFGLRWTIFTSFIMAAIVDLLIGLLVYLHNQTEQEKEKNMLEKEKELEEQQRLEMLELKEKYQESQEQILDLKIENSKMRDKVRLYENKARRKNKRLKKRGQI